MLAIPVHDCNTTARYGTQRSLDRGPISFVQGVRNNVSSSLARFPSGCVRGAVVNDQNPGFRNVLPHPVNHIGYGFLLVKRRDYHGDAIIGLISEFFRIGCFVNHCRLPDPISRRTAALWLGRTSLDECEME